MLLPLADASIFSSLPPIIGKTIMARDRTRSVHRIPALAICLPALGLPIVRISHRRGSLIPLSVSDHREADHTSSKLWTERYTHHTSHITVSTNLISFTPHPLSRGLLTSTVPASLQPDKDRQRARVYIPVSYGIYTL